MQRVVINGRFLDKPVTGVERYAREIASALDRMVKDRVPCVRGMAFVVARPRSDSPSFTTTIPEVRVGPFNGQLWEQTTLALFARGSVTLNLCNLMPLLASNQIVCVHDAHPWLIPDNFSWLFRTWYHFAVPRAIRRCARWTTVSRYSGDTLQQLGVARKPPDAITYNAADTFVQESLPNISHHPQVGTRPFVLCLGSESVNKNLSLIAEIAPVLQKHGIDIVAAGGARAGVFGSTSSSCRDGIIRLGRVSDDELRQLYAHALVFAFPSFYEGFGVPAIEAMQFACPVIASNTSAMPEVLGDAAILVDPHDSAAWISAILAVYEGPELRSHLVTKGLARAKKYRWDVSATALVELARGILECR